MKKVRIAQIGTSRYSHGNDIFNTLKKQTEIFEIAGYHFPEGEREKFPERASAFEGYEELTLSEILEDPTIEAVAIETEEKYLTKYALLAAKAGKHIHVEKPGGFCEEEFEALAREMKKSEKVFHVGYMYRYNPEIVKLLQEIKTGKLGEIISVEAQMNCLHPKEARRWLETLPGGMTFFLGCHLIDLIVQIQGFPQRILPLNKASGADGVTAKDFGMVVLEYPRGASFAKASAVEVGGFPRRRLVVSGMKKTVEIQPLEFWSEKGFEYGMYSEVTEYASEAWCYAGEKRKSDYYDRYESMTSAFAAMVRGEKENPYTIDYELALYKTVLACCAEK